MVYPADYQLPTLNRMRRVTQAIQTKMLTGSVLGVVSVMIVGEGYAEKKA